MTTQESFKKRVRARMARTGERYTTARHALLAKAPSVGRPWVSEPEMGDDAVRAATGRGWNDWCDVIDGWPRDSWDHSWDHAACARRLEADHGLDGWWSQSVTGGYERITGLRLPGQMPDGTFTANKSKTVRADASKLRRLLLRDEDRVDLFPGEPTELRSRPTSKVIRLGIGGGVALIDLIAKDDGRTTITVQHEKLAAARDVGRWRFWWADWLQAIDDEALDDEVFDHEGGADPDA